MKFKAIMTSDDRMSHNNKQYKRIIDLNDDVISGDVYVAPVGTVHKFKEIDIYDNLGYNIVYPNVDYSRLTRVFDNHKIIKDMVYVFHNIGEGKYHIARTNFGEFIKDNFYSPIILGGNQLVWMLSIKKVKKVV